MSFPSSSTNRSTPSVWNFAVINGRDRCIRRFDEPERLTNALERHPVMSPDRTEDVCLDQVLEGQKVWNRPGS